MMGRGWSRGNRSRLFMYLGIVALVGLAVYVFHGAQLQLDDARKAADKCQQQQESLSAQLQVIFEYKLRLEKSLQQEKTEHRQTREEFEVRAAEEKTRHDKENLEASNKYAAMQQQYKLLQSQHEDLSDDCKKVRMEQLQGLDERSKLESQLQAVQAELQQVQANHEKSLNSLKKELDAYKVHHLAETEVKHQNEDETLKSPEKPVSSSSAAPFMGIPAESQNVLQEAAPDKVRSSTEQFSGDERHADGFNFLRLQCHLNAVCYKNIFKINSIHLTFIPYFELDRFQNLGGFIIHG
ncbi:hypothetical protein L9F63_025498, partial [Diploptera punctata]